MAEESSKNKRERDEAEEDEEGDICSLQDVIDSEKESADIVTAVLGASDATNCSYDKGYVTRQALYGCATCFKETNELNGICLACSYSCHQNHELYELYTKRSFRCDCGNKRFATSSVKQCKLKASKDDFNDLNKYNHNFKGLYCTCDRTYPDTSESLNEEEEEDTMIQCTVCEDWYHTRHLVGYAACRNASDNYDEMICQLCMHKNNYLWYYQGYVAVKLELNESNNDAVDVENEENVENLKLPEHICKLKQLQEKYKSLKMPENQTCLFLNDWRDALCRCEDCLKMYTEHEVSFLTNNEDTIKHYEDKGKLEEEGKQVDENTLISNELSKLNHVSKVEFLHNVNSFKEELKEFLTSFANKGEVVKRENIDKFFEDLNQRKRQKLHDGVAAMGYYCK